MLMMLLNYCHCCFAVNDSIFITDVVVVVVIITVACMVVASPIVLIIIVNVSGQNYIVYRLNSKQQHVVIFG